MEDTFEISGEDRIIDFPIKVKQYSHTNTPSLNFKNIPLQEINFPISSPKIVQSND